MYPGTIFNWYDQSQIVVPAVATAENSPLFLTASSFDKGPEDMRIVGGSDFYKLYGNNPDFDKHGQAAIQAARTIDAGGYLLIKRVVADDATLANIILVATVDSKIKAVPAEAGTEGAMTLNEIMEADTSTDTDETQRYTTETSSTLKWTAVSVAGVRSPDEVLNQAKSLFVEGEYASNPIVGDGEGEGTGETTPGGSYMITKTSDFPLFVITDNGRGVSGKAVRIVPDYNTSRSMTNFFYTCFVYEGTNIVESISGTINPDSVIRGTNYGFNTDSSMQVNFYNVEDCYEAFISAFAKASGQTVKQASMEDIIYLKTSRNVSIPGISLDPDSVDLNSIYGVELTNGTNGAFGERPIETTEYENKLVEFFSGQYDDSIFDLDDYHLCAVLDANYPLAVKEAISELVTFREDCMFFRDLGTEVKSYASIIDEIDKFTLYNRYIADYLTNYQIYNPNTGKRITVTCMYDMAYILVDHFANGAYRPTAGIANNAVLESAIPGSVNFTPRITPSVNQKSLLEDLRINYAIFQSGRCVLQSLYTSQEAYTQLSYVNNVLAIQEVARAVRTACPKFRYTFGSGSDFSEYSSNVQKVLENFRNNFAELGFSYQQNALYASQKIFYAVITFRFNNWAQTEIFDLYALPTE